jgi:thymidylate synthase
MVSTMRSQDACRGFFLDTFAYPMIQQIISKDLNIPMGTYKHVVLNSHIYKDDLEFAQNILDRLRQEKPLIIDKLEKREKAGLEVISEVLYKEHDTKKAQKMAERLSPFWCNWKKNQIIYIYTKYLSEEQKNEPPTELTCVGPIFDTVMPRRKT